MRPAAFVAPLLFCGPALGAPPRAKLGGLWDTPAGRIQIVHKGGAVTGTVVEPSEACPFEKGETVIKGEVMEDTLTGEVRYCLFAPACGTKAGWSFAVLLADAKSTSLTGSGTAEDACAKGDESVVFTRARKDKPKGPVGLPAAAGAYDPRAYSKPQARARRFIEEGANYLAEGSFEKARAQFLKAIELAPNIPEAYNGVGVTYYARNQYDEALEWYKKALRAAPEFGDAYYNMACIYALTGKKALAIDYLTLAMLNGYKDWDEMANDHDLDSLKDEPAYKDLLKMR